jgi:hypothetical protein
MALQYTSANPLIFPNTAVGASSNGTVSVVAFSSNEDNVTAIGISGPGAAVYDISGARSLQQDYLAGDTGSGIIKFSPTSAITFNATFTITFDRFSGDGRLLQKDQQINLSLVGTGTGSGGGGGGGATGEATGLVQAFRRELIPVKSVTAGIVLAYFDETNFNDILDARTYIFKAQDILADRVPTTRRVVITYVDLGVATVRATITGVNDQGVLVTASAVVTLGTAGATRRLMTAFFDLAATCFRPQLTISQVANGGPFQLSTAMLTGQIETEVTL